MQRATATLETVLRHHPWLLALAALVPCAYFQAVGVNQVVARRLLAPDLAAFVRPAARQDAVPDAPPSHHARDLARILARDVFDSTAGCLNCAQAVGPGAEGADGATSEGATLAPCDGAARVVGAVEAEDSLWSFVLVAPRAGQASLPYRVGQALDGRTVTQIGWHERYGAFVVLRPSAGPRCFYAQRAPPGDGLPSSAGNATGDDPEPVDRGFQQAGPNEYNVQRGLVDRMLENQVDLLRTLRATPHAEHGRVTGVQLDGLRGTSLLGRLGMQNGDVLNRVNGLDISTPDRALEAYSRLRTADHVTLSITRNGQPVSLDYNIR
jgi:general secretion pathway protein C